ncbi:M48 family metallopeptidase, partial [Acidobacteriota bacterium]
FNYRVTLVDSPAVNAVTPPGHIIVYTGLLAFTETESELAGVLAHELAHNYGHHVGRKLIKATIAQGMANSAYQAIDPKSQLARMATTLGMQAGVGLFVKAYSRFEEKEADHYGAHILYNAGYDPTAMSIFFLKMYKANPKQPVKFLSTHPPIPDRADYITEYLESFPLNREMRSDTEKYQQIRKRVLGRGRYTAAPQNQAMPPAGSPPSP